MKVTVDDIRKLCTKESFERGIEYLREDRVRNIHISGNKVTSTVKGTYSYRVEVDLDKDLEASCTCPYDFEGYCKHIVATLVALSRNYEKIRDARRREKERTSKALDIMSPKELKDFLKAEVERDETVRTHFLVYATGESDSGKSVHDYKEDMGMLYRDAVGRYGHLEYGNNVDFSTIRDLAERYIDKKNFLEAAKIYQALSESIAENMDMVDDSDGYYGGEFTKATENLVSCLKSANLNHNDKRRYIDYLFKKYIQNDPDYFQEDYEDALMQLCTTKEDLIHWKELLSPYVPDTLPPDDARNWIKRHRAEELLLMEEFILDALANKGDDNSRDELYRLFAKYVFSDYRLCVLYAKRLEKDGKVEEAAKVAEEGLRRFPRRLTTQLQHFLDKYYELRDPGKYKQNLMKLFFQELDWDYYDRLKEICDCSEWSTKMLPSIITHFSSSHEAAYGERAVVVDVYLKEGMFDEAVGEVLRRRSLHTLGFYYKQLSKRYPKEYFQAYKQLIPAYAESRSGRDHYSDVVSKLKKMKGIRGFEGEFEQFSRMLKEMYAKKPAFLDELRNL